MIPTYEQITFFSIDINFFVTNVNFNTLIANCISRELFFFSFTSIEIFNIERNNKTFNL